LQNKIKQLETRRAKKTEFEPITTPLNHEIAFYNLRGCSFDEPKGTLCSDRQNMNPLLQSAVIFRFTIEVPMKIAILTKYGLGRNDSTVQTPANCGRAQTVGPNRFLATEVHS
jgi:hypothetical protein